MNESLSSLAISFSQDWRSESLDLWSVGIWRESIAALISASVVRDMGFKTYGRAHPNSVSSLSRSCETIFFVLIRRVETALALIHLAHSVRGRLFQTPERYSPVLPQNRRYTLQLYFIMFVYGLINSCSRAHFWTGGWHSTMLYWCCGGVNDWLLSSGVGFSEEEVANNHGEQLSRFTLRYSVDKFVGYRWMNGGGVLKFRWNDGRGTGIRTHFLLIRKFHIVEVWFGYIGLLEGLVILMEQFKCFISDFIPVKKNEWADHQHIL